MMALAFIIAAVFFASYIMNIYKMFERANEDVACKLIRLVGIFVPVVGVIAGFLN